MFAQLFLALRTMLCTGTVDLSKCFLLLIFFESVTEDIGLLGWENLVFGAFS